MRYRGPVSDHFDGRRFHNRHSGWQTEGSFIKWQLTKKPGAWRKWIDEQPGPRPLTKVDDGRVRVTWINHATMLVQMDGVNRVHDWCREQQRDGRVLRDVAARTCSAADCHQPLPGCCGHPHPFPPFRAAAKSAV